MKNLEKIISNLEKEAIKLETVCKKLDYDYRANSSGFNYGKALDTRNALGEIRQQIVLLKDDYVLIRAYSGETRTYNRMSGIFQGNAHIQPDVGHIPSTTFKNLR